MDESSLTKTERRAQRSAEKEESSQTQRRLEMKRRLMMTVVILAIIAGLVGLVIWQNQRLANSISQAYDDPKKGAEDAKVIVREFSDFQCPACRAAQPFVEQMLGKYRDRILFVYEDFPLVTTHRHAMKAAQAGQCALEQGKFFEVHDVLFEEQPQWSVEDDPTGTLIGYAKDEGLNEEQFRACLTSEKTKPAVEEDMDQARALRVTGTPTFFVNNKLLVNPRSFADFERAIDEALNKAGTGAENANVNAATNANAAPIVNENVNAAANTNATE